MLAAPSTTDQNKVGEAASKDRVIIWLAERCGGNGKITRYFLLEGLSMDMVTHIVGLLRASLRLKL